MVSTFTTLIDQLTSTTDENELNLKFMELTALMNSPQKPSKESFINWATQQNDIQITNLMSLCLDTYVPYFDIVIKLIDPEWVLIHALPKHIRSEISTSFTTLLNDYKQSPNNSGYLFNIAIHLTTMKYSGIFSEYCFNLYLGELSQRFNGLTFESIEQFIDEQNNIHPEIIIKRLIQVTSVFYGQDTTQKFISHLFSSNQSSTLTISNGWLNYEEWLKSLVQKDLVYVCNNIEKMLIDFNIRFEKSAHCYCQDWNLFDIKLNEDLINDVAKKYPEIKLG